MKSFYKIKRVIWLMILSVIIGNTYAQNEGVLISNTVDLPHPDAALEIKSLNKKLLAPDGTP